MNENFMDVQSYNDSEDVSEPVVMISKITPSLTSECDANVCKDREESKEQESASAVSQKSLPDDITVPSIPAEDSDNSDQEAK